MGSALLPFSDFMILALLGGLVAIDETAFLQIMISRPLVAGSLVGLAFGDLDSGLFFGAMAELIYLDALPAGAARFPDSGLATVVGTGLIVLAGRHGMSPSAGVWLVALLMAVLVGRVGERTITFVRRRNNGLCEEAVRRLESGQLRAVSVYHLMGLAFFFLRGMFLTFVLAMALFPVVGWAGEILPAGLDFPLIIGRNLILCASLALGLRLFVSARTLVYFVVGAGITWAFIGLGI